MCAKVTPKPLNEPVKVPTSALLFVCFDVLAGTAADRRRFALRGYPPQPRARRYLEVHRRYREAALGPGEVLGLQVLRGALRRGRLAGREDRQPSHDHEGRKA